MNGSPNDLMPSRRGSAPLFIARWDRRAPQDQTNLTQGQDDSSEAVEEASRRGAETVTGGNQSAPWWGQPIPLGGLWPLVSSGVFQSLPTSHS